MTVIGSCANEVLFWHFETITNLKGHQSLKNSSCLLVKVNVIEKLQILIGQVIQDRLLYIYTTPVHRIVRWQNET